MALNIRNAAAPARPGEPAATAGVRLQRAAVCLFAFLVSRVRTAGAYGVSLAVGILVLGAAAVSFAAITEDVLHREELTWLDDPVNRAVVNARTSDLTALMRAITALGGLVGILTVVAVGGLLLRLRAGTWRPAGLLAVVAAGAAGLDVLVKVVVARPRPPSALAVTTADGYAFPSGHTTQAAVYGCLAFLVSRTLRQLWAKLGVWAAALLIAAGIGLSRVYLGVHWTTDVLGGWALAAAWLAFVLTVATVLAHLRPGSSLLPPCPTD